jgi:hypothetical protein
MEQSPLMPHPEVSLRTHAPRRTRSALTALTLTAGLTATLTLAAGAPVFAATSTTYSNTPTTVVAGDQAAFGGASMLALDADGRRYVGNYFSGNVLVFAADAEGNVAPERTITGASSVIGVALNSAGILFAADNSQNAIRGYGADANGAATPVQLISGNNTGLNNVRGLAIDDAGLIYAANYLGDSVTVYAADATGNAVPLRTISGANTGISDPGGIALDTDGNLYVSNNLDNSITVYAPEADGDAVPLRTIAGANTGRLALGGLAVDAAGYLYAANYGNDTITVYAPGADGDVFPVALIDGGTPALTDVIGIAVDSAGTIHAAGLSNFLYSYVAAPTITDVSPNTGPVDAGTLVTITGTGFVSGTTVTIGNLPATNVTIVNGTKITAVLPARAAGSADLTVTTPGGTTTATGVFTYVDSVVTSSSALAATGFTGTRLAFVAGLLLLGGIAVLVVSGVLARRRRSRAAAEPAAETGKEPGEEPAGS